MPSIMSFIITVGLLITIFGFWLGGEIWYIGFVGIGLIIWMIGTFVYYLKKEIPKMADEMWNDYNVEEGMKSLEQNFPKCEHCGKKSDGLTLEFYHRSGLCVRPQNKFIDRSEIDS